MEKTKIKEIKTVIVDIPIKRPHQFSTEKVSTKSFVLIKLALSNGVVGIGEGTTPGIWWNGESVETMKLVIDRYAAPLLLDEEPEYIEKLLQKLNRQIRGNAFAKATVEMALFDALGKNMGYLSTNCLGACAVKKYLSAGRLLPVRRKVISKKPKVMSIRKLMPISKQSLGTMLRKMMQGAISVLPKESTGGLQSALIRTAHGTGFPQ